MLINNTDVQMKAILKSNSTFIEYPKIDAIYESICFFFISDTSQ